MKLKNFQDLVEKRLTKKEIAEIKRQAELEVKMRAFLMLASLAHLFALVGQEPTLFLKKK